MIDQKKLIEASDKSKNKLSKLGDAIAISKSETMNHSLTDPLTHWLTGVGALGDAIASKK